MLILTIKKSVNSDFFFFFKFDDIVIIYKNFVKKIDKLKKKLNKSFAVKDLGPAKKNITRKKKLLKSYLKG